MCGICISLSFRERSGDERQNDVVSQNLLARLKRRGPNHFETLSSSFSDVLDLHFISSVLQLRGGSSPSLQPVTDSSGNILLWNGEIFDETLVKECQSDTKFLSEKLFTCTESSDVLSIIESIKGPFAFVFYQSNGLLWFGRDVFGRRSLLWRADPVAFCLCSVSDAASEWKEVSARGVYCLDLKQTSLNKSFIIYLYPWSSTPSGSCLFQNLDEEVSAHVILTVKSEKSIKNPILNILNKSFPSDELLEVFKFPEESYKSKDRNADFFKHFLEISEISGPLLVFEEVLSNAVRKRVQNHHHICKKCFTPVKGTQQDWTCGHASVGVLFSGGLDSIVIACLADRHLKDCEPIDLLNVAFASNMNLRKSTAADRHSVYETPDRVTGRNGVMALRKICPNRTWNFVEVNITEEDLINERRDTISHLLRPSCTVLDDSIGCALWFASHGKGILASDKGCESYSSPVRVLLVGMGADEQLGGYSRHRAKFNSFGWPGLIEELTLELDRISSRNLGRDDRIIADNGVESRYPFLDENVVSFLNSLPVWLKMNLNYPRGIGEKLLLRLLAYKLGLHDAAALPKRAIQFGSRIARIENWKEKGSDVCERLKNL